MTFTSIKYTLHGKRNMRVVTYELTEMCDPVSITHYFSSLLLGIWVGRLNTI
jgi:hypothetical protein